MPPKKKVGAKKEVGKKAGAKPIEFEAPLAEEDVAPEPELAEEEAEAAEAPAEAPAEAHADAPAEAADAEMEGGDEAGASAGGEGTEAAKTWVEHETDAAPAKGQSIQDVCVFRTEDTTLNVMQTVTGKHLMALSDGGFQYFLAGARASVGLKAGRYMFEVLLTECKGTTDSPPGKAAGPRPKCYARMGFATEDASLLLGDGALSVCFDTEGFFTHGKTRTKVCSNKVGQGQVAALLLNLDPSSPNANTVSLFVDGVRASPPQALPDGLKGKVLYPAVTYRNLTLQVHFGKSPLRPLPFKCLTVQEALVTDGVVRKAAEKNGKHEVIVPVGLPDEGTFDWLDGFLAKHRDYVELSDRAILDWANKSGLPRQGGYSKRSCNDKPELGFGLPGMDDFSLQKVISMVAPLLPRNYVIMEVKDGLLESGRKELLDRFPSSDFNKVARVVIGEPPADFKNLVHEHTLKEKQDRAEGEARRKKVEVAKKKAAEEAKRKREAAEKKRQEAVKKAKGAKAKAREKKEGEEGAAEEEAAAEEAAEEEAKEEEDAKMEEEVKEEEVKVELTAEEKQRHFIKRDIPDLVPKDMSGTYMKFTIPKKEEGFDNVVFEWQSAGECQTYLESWISDRKVTQRVEDLQPSDWFRSKHNEWQKALASWKKKAAEHKDPSKKKAAEAAKRKAVASKSKKEGGEEGDEEEKDEEDVAAEEAKEEAKIEIDVDDLDVFAVEDINDLGNGAAPVCKLRARGLGAAHPQIRAAPASACVQARPRRPIEDSLPRQPLDLLLQQVLQEGLQCEVLRRVKVARHHRLDPGHCGNSAQERHDGVAAI